MNENDVDELNTDRKEYFAVISLCLAAMLSKCAQHIWHLARLPPKSFCRSQRRLFANKSPFNEAEKLRNRSIAYYSLATVVLCGGLTYAAVPLYRLFCQVSSRLVSRQILRGFQSTGYGGTIDINHDATKVEHMKKVENTLLRIRFVANINSSMRWNFKPLQYEIKVIPGETALAFYSAKNPTDTPVIGISTYNVIPFEAGPYFNKIQCFCFEAQQLNPHEEVRQSENQRFRDYIQFDLQQIFISAKVDMPVFFYIDPEFVDDPKMEFVDTITLSYTFFESKDGVSIPIPNYARPHGSK